MIELPEAILKLVGADLGLPEEIEMIDGSSVAGIGVSAAVGSYERQS